MWSELFAFTATDGYEQRSGKSHSIQLLSCDNSGITSHRRMRIPPLAKVHSTAIQLIRITQLALTSLIVHHCQSTDAWLSCTHTTVLYTSVQHGVNVRCDGSSIVKEIMEVKTAFCLPFSSLSQRMSASSVHYFTHKRWSYTFPAITLLA